jgi:creatinine amidohydrolase/Fe(II)-dependent formamide hydrolase-like protein
MKKTAWMDMFPHEFHQEMARAPICYMPYGPAEPHGVYNALGLDFLECEALMHDVAATHGGIVAPPFAWHIQEQQYYDWEMDCCGMGMSITSSLPEELFLHNVIPHIRNFDAKGFKAAILVSGHFLGDMTADLTMLAELYVRRTGSPMQISAGTYERFYTDGQFDDHAGLVETALLMYYRPELVDLSLIGKPLAVPASIAGGNEDYDPYCAPKGFGSGVLPTSEMGRAIAGNMVENLGREKTRLLAAYQEKPGYKAPSVLDTEDIWHRFLKHCGRYLTITATRREAENSIFPTFPGWEELGE